MSGLSLLVILIGLAFVLLIPRGTNVPYTRRPVVTLALIGVNLVVHLVTQGLQLLESSPLARLLGEQSGVETMPAYLDLLALNPAKVLNEGGWRYLQIITANFLHQDWLHLLFNMWYFYLFSVNLEDRLGPLRFGALIAAALVTSQAAVLVLTRGLGAGAEAHAGFSGVVYATLAAYFVCLPRSKINVVLIYSLTFWGISLFVGGFVSLLIGLVVGPLAELAWLACFILAFLYLEPGHISFGIPAFIFLGHRLLFDAVTIEQQMRSAVSVWSHAGGFLCGLVVALAFNGLRGLRETFANSQDAPAPTARQRERERAASLAEAAARDEGAAKELLGRLVFLGNAGAAARLYVDTVMRCHPRLCLDLPAMITLARMLEAQGQRAAALDACARAIGEHGTEPGIEQVYLHAARLCVGYEGHGREGLRYADQVLAVAVLNRDKYEAKKLREQLAEQAKQESEETGSADAPELPPLVESQPEPVSASTDDPWAARKLAPLAFGASSRRPRMTRIEPSQQSPAPAQAALEGRKPLPMKTPLDFQPSPDFPPEPAATKPPQRATGRATVIEIPRKPLPTDAVPPAPEIRTAGSLQRELLPEGYPERPAVSGGDALFSPPPISASAGTPGLRPSASGESARVPADMSCVVLLSDTRETAGRPFTECLAELASRVGLTVRPATTQRLALLRGLTLDQAQQVAAEAAQLSLSVKIVRGDHPALTEEPLEMTSVTLDEEVVTLRSAAVAIRHAYPDIVLLHYSCMRLSPASKNARLVLEIVAMPEGRRVQLWARTLAPDRCSILGVPPPPDCALHEIARALAGRIPSATLTPVTAGTLLGGGAPVELSSFEDYETYVLFYILGKTGKSPE
ncbi:MAG: rhomboid family intramembrane serine protease [Candidatus Sumerlaeaceae bacterium]|nr:rhomboid family intramembrane serine protease [Candidatus Sumerlaeaceae bacterium]